MPTDMTKRDQLVASLRNKEYRDQYVSALISIGLPSQIREMRQSRGWSQARFAEVARMHQSQISEFERTGCESFTLSSLLRLASAFDVGLKVRFVPFSELAQEDAHPERYELDAASFGQDVRLNKEWGDYVMDLGAAREVYLRRAEGAVPIAVGTTEAMAYTAPMEPVSTIEWMGKRHA